MKKFTIPPNSGTLVDVIQKDNTVITISIKEGGQKKRDLPIRCSVRSGKTEISLNIDGSNKRYELGKGTYIKYNFDDGNLILNTLGGSQIEYPS
ncbi:hypothetical protein KY358_00250 [Candidatus Woesearchaeota archaeon]|nr:hypothetical protein [Candidatus Woesearchaeota archaeon]